MMTPLVSRRPATGASALLVLLLCLQGCSLFSFESPAKPLPRRDLNARMLTRDYAQHFGETVAQTADDIAKANTDPAVQLATLQWKVAATAASRRAATQMSPLMALLDSWALSAQMREFLGTGAGSALFGEHQTMARDAAVSLEQQMQRLAASLTSKTEFASFTQFVDGYVRDHPLQGIDFARASVLDLWVSQTGQQATLLSTLGTAPEAMSDVAERMRLYGDQLPEQTMWQAQLVVRQAGYQKSDFHDALSRIDARLARIAKLAETSPEMVHGAVADLRTDLLEVTDRLDVTWSKLIQALHEERVAFASDVRTERVELTSAVDQQRAAIMKDAGQIAVQVTEATWQHLRAFVRQLTLLALLAIVVVLGLPFVAGYYVGRARTARSASHRRSDAA